MLPDLEDLHDVGVLEPGHRLGLDAHAEQPCGFRMGTGQDQLEGHHSVQGDLPGTVHDPHAAPAELSLDDKTIRGQGRAR